METKKHLFGTTEKSDFILNMTKEGTYKLLTLFAMISMWVLSICAVPYYLTKDTVKYTEELGFTTVTHYATENTLSIMPTVAVAVGFVSILMFIIARMKHEASLKGKRGLITLAVLIVLSLISMFTADSLRSAFFGHTSRADGFLEFLAYCGFVAMGLIVTDNTWRRRFCDNLVAIGAFQSVVGIAQCISPKVPNFFNELFLDMPTGVVEAEAINDRGYVMMKQSCATGFLCSPHALAAALTVLFAFAAAGFMYSKGKKRRPLYLIAAVLMAAASILTHVMPGLVGIPCVLAVLLVTEIIRLKRKNVLWNKKVLDNALTCCVILIAAVGVVFAGLKIGGGLKLYDEEVIFTDSFARLSTSYYNRLNTDVGVYKDFRHIGSLAVTYELDEKMFLGAGQDCISYMFGAVQGLRTDRLYNDYIDFILQRGIIAFASYCVFLIYIIYRGIKAVAAFYKKDQPFYGVAALAGLIGFLVTMFWNTSGNTHTYFLYLCAGMMIMYSTKKPVKKAKKKENSKAEKA